MALEAEVQDTEAQWATEGQVEHCRSEEPVQDAETYSPAAQEPEHAAQAPLLPW